MHFVLLELKPPQRKAGDWLLALEKGQELPHSLERAWECISPKGRVSWAFSSLE